MYIDNKTVKSEDIIHITGYHGTIEEYVPQIEKNGFDPTFSKKKGPLVRTGSVLL